jgi:hypothetical protein
MHDYLISDLLTDELKRQITILIVINVLLFITHIG